MKLLVVVLLLGALSVGLLFSAGGSATRQAHLEATAHADAAQRSARASERDDLPKPRTLAPLASTEGGVEELRERVALLEARLATLEARGPAAERQRFDPIPAPERERASLEAVVLDTLARVDREQRNEAEQRASELEALGQLESEQNVRFQLGIVVGQLSSEVELLAGEKEVLVDVLVEYERRRTELSESFDPLHDDPALAEAQLDQLDAWLEQELAERVGGELARTLSEYFD